MTTTRIDQLRTHLQAQGLEALAAVPGANLHYLAGMDFSTKLRLTTLIIPLIGTPVLVLPALELERAKAQVRGEVQIITWSDGEGPTAALAKAAALTNLAGKRIGIEHNVMRVFELRGLEAAAPASEIIDATPLLSAMRMTKDSAELAAMREAVRLIEQTLHETIAAMRVGMTEQAVAEIWMNAIRATGCPPSFDVAVGSGPNGANPHHTNGERQLQDGDLVVLDGGVYFNGYASDITRTIAIGTPNAEALRIYELVLAANTAGRAACRPESTGAQIDLAARTIIEQGGYGPQFVHRTGHGLGMEIHEPPFIVGGSHEPLTPGMTFTVEPGIYLPGVVGVRIEDDMVITETGAESLTSFPRNLISIS
jgi:Xaa-Pro aminopeptidase